MRFFKEKRQTNQASPNLMLRRLERSDLPELNENWSIKGPHFVGVGVPKAGTSWWYRMLLSHQNIVPHRMYDMNLAVSKELNYFPHFKYSALSREDKELYVSCFSAPPGCISGEWSTAYFSNPFCISALADTAPSVKVLVMLRNPVDRTLSHVNHLRLNRQKLLEIPPAKEHVFAVHNILPEALLFSFYATGLRLLNRHFGPENVLVLQYEQCVSNPTEQMSRTLRFLDLADLGFEPDYSERVNEQDFIVAALTRQERQHQLGIPDPAA